MTPRTAAAARLLATRPTAPKLAPRRAGEPTSLEILALFAARNTGSISAAAKVRWARKENAR